MDAEYGALMKNKTWHLVPPSSNKNLIDCKWVYRIKRLSDGTIDRYKARLVTKGNTYSKRYVIVYQPYTNTNSSIQHNLLALPLDAFCSPNKLLSNNFLC